MKFCPKISGGIRSLWLSFCVLMEIVSRGIVKEVVFMFVFKTRESYFTFIYLDVSDPNSAYLKAGGALLC